jgi:hypothetical protein
VGLYRLIGADESTEFMAADDIRALKRHQRWSEELSPGQSLRHPRTGFSGIEQSTDHR